MPWPVRFFPKRAAFERNWSSTASACPSHLRRFYTKALAVGVITRRSGLIEDTLTPRLPTESGGQAAHDLPPSDDVKEKQWSHRQEHSRHDGWYIHQVLAFEVKYSQREHRNS